MTRAFLGLGANLGDPRAQLEDALRRLERPDLTIVRVAPFYRSRPVGPPGQPDYVNSAAEIETTLSPEALLDAAKGVEADLGRVTLMRWGPRVIDVDILIYGTVCVDTPRLVIPHRELANRRFVLAPLADLAPDLVVPGAGKSVRELLASLADDPGCVWRDA
ncbi:2-amino-4-hydroxy-6-hydroxymethyldihydropteridine diphosphokinase [Myxococcota bacterium]|nr:2-amino-4-hydroxy-6-hydroxymethyldihydropteridine diphosphokinase [Myxococcota bacterium]